jgi:hypothetical protein
VRRVAVCLLVAPLLGACATDPYGNNLETRTIGGVLVGGALGALAGRSVGLDPVAGAAAGMAVGGATGYAVGGRHSPVRERQYYKDSQGYCYYVDQAGVPHYDVPPVRC